MKPANTIRIQIKGKLAIHKGQGKGFVTMLVSQTDNRTRISREHVHTHDGRTSKWLLSHPAQFTGGQGLGRCSKFVWQAKDKSYPPLSSSLHLN